MRKVLLVILGAVGGGMMLFALILSSAACLGKSGPAALSQGEEVLLPAEVLGTELYAEQLVCYDGAFLEDGSMFEVTGAAALMIRNQGSTGVQRARVFACQGDRILEFELSCLPPGQAVLVLEKNMQRYSREVLSCCYGEAEYTGLGWNPLDYLEIQEEGMDTLVLKNKTDSVLQNILLHYKTAYADGLFYLGGISYTVALEALAPEQQLSIKPEHYACGISSILQIQFQEEAPQQPENRDKFLPLS